VVLGGAPAAVVNAAQPAQDLTFVLAADELMVRTADDGGKGPRVKAQQCWVDMCVLQIPSGEVVYGSTNEGRTWSLYVPVRIEVGSLPLLVRKAQR